MRATMGRLLAMTLIIVGVLLGASTPSEACSCAALEPAEAFDVSDAVFIGEIEDIRRPGSVMFREQEARYIFSAETVFKGDVYERQSVVTHAQGATCGMEFSGPGRFLIFATETAFGGPAPDSGELSTSLCSGNTIVGPEFTADEFGGGFAPLAGSSPAGSAGLTTLAWGGLLAVTLAVALIGAFIGSRLRHRNVA